MLDLEITSACNLSCRWCFVRAVRPERHMRLDQIETLLAEARPVLGPSLHLTGGEPLVHPRFKEILDSAEALGYTQLILNTNGLLLDEPLCRDLADRKLQVTLYVSLDGPRWHHETNRGPESFQPAFEGVLAALEQELTVNVLTIVTTSLLAHLQRFVIDLFSVAEGLGGVTFIPVGDVSQGQSEQTRPLNEEALVRLVQLSSAFLLTGHNVRILDYPLANLVYRALGMPTSLVGSHCTACRSRLSVQSDGQVTPCHPVWLPVGRYEPGNLAEILESRLCRAVAQRDYEGCRTCPDRELCGHCRAVVLAGGRHILDNDWSCRRLRSLLADRPQLRESTKELAESIEADRPDPDTALKRLTHPVGPTQDRTHPSLWNGTDQEEVPRDMAHR